MRIAKPSANFGPEKQEALVQYVVTGGLIGDWLAANKVDRNDVFRARTHDKDFAERLDEALAEQSFAWCDKLASVHEQYSDPAVARIASENMRWIMTRNNAKRYSEKYNGELKVTASDSLLEALRKK